MWYKITWDAGFGPTERLVDCATLEEAKKIAEEQWREEAEVNATYTAEEWDEAQDPDLEEL